MPTSAIRSRARFLIAQGFLPFWLRQAGNRAPTEEEFAAAKALAEEGLEIAERVDDPALVSAAIDALTSPAEIGDPNDARELSERRVAMGRRLPADERLDALNMVAWFSALMGDFEPLFTASEEALALTERGQNVGFAMGGGSWHAYAAALVGRWDAVQRDVDQLVTCWIESERPAAAYGLQGFLSGIDWARHRGDEQRAARWGEVAAEIIGRFAADHPVAALRSIVDLDLEGIARIVERADRYPDRAHYVEHATAILADRAASVPLSSLTKVIERGAERGYPVVEAQARRLRGILTRSPDDLAASLRGFVAIGAHRYAARVRRELGRLGADQAMAAAGERELDGFGELDSLLRLDRR